MQENCRINPVWLLLGGVALLGASPIFVRIIPTDPVATAAWRMLFALPFSMGLYYLMPHTDKSAVPVRKAKGRAIVMALLAGISLALNLALWSIAVREISIATATLLDNMAPVAIAPLAWWLFGERPTRQLVLGLSVAIVGATLLCGVAGNSGPTTGNALLGTSAAIIAAVLYAAYFIFLKLADRHGLPSRQLLWLANLGATLTLLPLMLLEGGNWLPGSWSGWVAILAYALVVQAWGQGWVGQGFARLPSGPASLALLLQPIFSALLAWLLLSEQMGGLEILGGILVLLGLAGGSGAIKWSVFTRGWLARQNLQTRPTTPD